MEVKFWGIRLHRSQNISYGGYDLMLHINVISYKLTQEFFSIPPALGVFEVWSAMNHWPQKTASDSELTSHFWIPIEVSQKMGRQSWPFKLPSSLNSPSLFCWNPNLCWWTLPRFFSWVLQFVAVNPTRSDGWILHKFVAQSMMRLPTIRLPQTILLLRPLTSQFSHLLVT